MVRIQTDLPHTDPTQVEVTILLTRNMHEGWRV